MSVAQEQRNEVGLLLGAAFVPQTSIASGQKLNFGKSITYSLDYARRIREGNTALLLEFPFAAAPSSKVESTEGSVVKNLAALFVTPSLRVHFVNHAAVSPWLSGGFGYRLYEGSNRFEDGAANPQLHRNVATAQVGGGLELRTPLRLLFPVGFRAEVRDYYSLDAPRFGVPVRRSEQHNTVVAGGLVVRF